MIAKAHANRRQEMTARFVHASNGKPTRYVRHPMTNSVPQAASENRIFILTSTSSPWAVHDGISCYKRMSGREVHVFRSNKDEAKELAKAKGKCVDCRTRVVWIVRMTLLFAGVEKADKLCGFDNDVFEVDWEVVVTGGKRWVEYGQVSLLFCGFVRLREFIQR